MLRRRELIAQGKSMLPNWYKPCKYITIQNDKNNGARNGILTTLYWDEIRGIKFCTQFVCANKHISNYGIMLFASAPVTRVPSVPVVGFLKDKKLSQYYSGFSNYLAEPDPTFSEYLLKEQYDISISFDCTLHKEVTFGCWYDFNYSQTNNWSTVEFIGLNGETVGKYIPCLDGNGVPCFYDSIRKNTHYNQFTGEFLYELA